jgi:hypothetical protein
MEFYQAIRKKVLEQVTQGGYAVSPFVISKKNRLQIPS